MMAIAPSVTWLMGARTTLTVEADYLRLWYSSTNAYAVPARGSVLPNINGELPHILFTQLPDFDKNDRRSYRIGYDLTHQFNDRWSIRNAYRYNLYEANVFNSFGLALLAEQRTMTRSWNSVESSVIRQQQQSMITNVVGHFQVLEMDHALLLGVELRQTGSSPQVQTTRVIPPIDLFAPNYALVPGAVTGTQFSESGLQTRWILSPGSDYALAESEVHGGFRFDYVHQTIKSGITQATEKQTSDDMAVSPRLGLVYQPIEPISLYTTWMQGFPPEPTEYVQPGRSVVRPATLDPL